MSNERDDNEVWENLVLFIVLGGLAVFGYHKLKPVIEGWLKGHGVRLDQVVHSLGSISLDRVIDIAALILGLFLLITLLLAWRRLRGRKRKHHRVW